MKWDKGGRSEPNGAPTVAGFAGFLSTSSGDGKGPTVEAFVKQINVAARLGRWTDCHKYFITRSKCKGIAAEFLEGLDDEEEEEPTYAGLKLALEERFKKIESVTVKYQKFYGIKMKQDETVAEYAARIKKASRDIALGREGNVPRIKDEMLTAQFIAGLTFKFKEHVLNKKPTHWL